MTRPTRRPPDHGHGNPAEDPPGTCRWRNPADSGPWIKVTDGRWVHVGGGGAQDDAVVAGWPVGPLRHVTPEGMADRLRTAGHLVHDAGRLDITGQHFDDLADRLESGLLPPDVAAAVVRALLGERL